MTRAQILDQITHTKSFDIIIIGGGASGLGSALEASLRGYSVCLIEQYDFAKGTSSKATKLVHGGVRYLAQGNYSLVREALRERGFLLKNAPHLCHKLELIIPAKTRRAQWFYYIGLKLYDFLSGSLSLGSTRWLSKAETLERLPALNPQNVYAGISFYDGQFNDARLAIELAQHAQKNGACLLNYAKLSRLEFEHAEISGIEFEDVLTGQKHHLKAKSVINATGVYVDDILKTIDPTQKAPDVRVVASKGTHIVIDSSFFKGTRGLMIPKTEDGRVLFAIPWLGNVILGTTDEAVPHKDIEPKATEQDIEFIVHHFNKYVSKPIQKRDILSVYAGLRPLVSQGNDQQSKELNRNHVIFSGPRGLVTMTGGKWTTYRQMGEDAVNQVEKDKLWSHRASKTKHYSFINKAKITPGHLTSQNYIEYGENSVLINDLVLSDVSLKEQIHPDYTITKAQVVFAVKYEWAQTLEDVLARRTRLLFLDAKAALEAAPVVAKLIAQELERDSVWIDQELARFSDLVNRYRV